MELRQEMYKPHENMSKFNASSIGFLLLVSSILFEMIH